MSFTTVAQLLDRSVSLHKISKYEARNAKAPLYLLENDQYVLYGTSALAYQLGESYPIEFLMENSIPHYVLDGNAYPIHPDLEGYLDSTNIPVYMENSDGDYTFCGYRDFEYPTIEALEASYGYWNNLHRDHRDWETEESYKRFDENFAANSLDGICLWGTSYTDCVNPEKYFSAGYQRTTKMTLYFYILRDAAEKRRKQNRPLGLTVEEGMIGATYGKRNNRQEVILEELGVTIIVREK